MKQPTKTKAERPKKMRKPTRAKSFRAGRNGRTASVEGVEVGVSNLERDFARDFLDANGVEYIYQYEAKDMKRYYDFAVVAEPGVYEYTETEGIRHIAQKEWVKVDLLIEIDGGYWHADPRVVDESKIRPMHRHNRYVDNLKDKWASNHHIPLLRFWEEDIRNDRNKVMETLRQYVALTKGKTKAKREKVNRMSSRRNNYLSKRGRGKKSPTII